MTVHLFEESLARSHEQENAPWWEDVYRKAFPAFATMANNRADGWAQRGGIDRTIVLKSGKTIWVDEKVRAKSYGDILLERWSSREAKTPGWAQKDLACDYIAYAFVPDQRCYLLPTLALRAAWLTCGRGWIEKAEAEADGFRTILARNATYTTESIAVPIPVLMAAIQDAQTIDWGRT